MSKYFLPEEVCLRSKPSVCRREGTLALGLALGLLCVSGCGRGAPALNAVSPVLGPTGGGILVTLHGDNLGSAATVSFAGVQATHVKVVSDQMITAILPAMPGAQGHVPVMIQGPDGESVMRGDLFTYYTTTPQWNMKPYPAGSSPSYVAIADLNGDGKLDLVVPSYGDEKTNSRVSVLLGNGDGTFGNAGSSLVGVSPRSVAIGDWNGDGKMDLAVVNNGQNMVHGTVSVLLGNGNGTFQNAQSFDVGERPLILATSDLNGDGKADLVVPNSGSSRVSLLLGNGDGTFQNVTDVPVGTGPVTVAIGDLNGDGRLDLAVANSGSNNVSVLLGDGHGAFQNAQNFSVATTPFSVAIGDLNGDGKLDLATANRDSGNVSVLLGNGNGTFQNAQNTQKSSVGTAPFSMAIGDLNGDGKPDLVTSDFATSSVYVLLGNGDGSFQTPLPVPVGGSPQFVAVRDLNGDGRADLAIADANGIVTILLNDFQ